MAMAMTETPQAVNSLRQPDIDYTPNFDKYVARTKKRLENEVLTKSLPPGFPTKLSSDLVWEGASLERTFSAVYELSLTEIEEVKQGLAHFKNLGKPAGYINQETFPLPTLHEVLRGISKEIHFGHGFKILRGIDVSKYTREENIMIFAGISSHVASIRGRQDSKYEGKSADVVLGHIKDLSHTAAKDRIGSPSVTAENQVFHTDAGDIVSLFVLGTSAQGGRSKLASCYRIYNEIAENRPDLIWTMQEPWSFEIYGNPTKQYELRPIMFYFPETRKRSERLVFQYARRIITGYQQLPRSIDIPPITEAQAEAIDALHYAAEKFAVTMEFKKGDIQYVNNLTLFHARTEFKDTPDQTRHLIRLWLRDEENGWPTPEHLSSVWDRLYGNLSPEASVFPLEAQMREGVDGKK